MPAPGEPPYPWPRGKVAAHALPSTIEDVLRSPSSTGVHFAMSRQAAGDNACAIIDSGSARAHREPATYPFTAHGLCRYPLPAGKSIEPWLALVRDLAAALEAVRASSGSIPKSAC